MGVESDSDRGIEPCKRVIFVAFMAINIGIRMAARPLKSEVECSSDQKAAIKVE